MGLDLSVRRVDACLQVKTCVEWYMLRVKRNILPQSLWYSCKWIK